MQTCTKKTDRGPFFSCIPMQYCHLRPVFMKTSHKTENHETTSSFAAAALRTGSLRQRRRIPYRDLDHRARERRGGHHHGLRARPGLHRPQGRERLVDDHGGPDRGLHLRAGDPDDPARKDQPDRQPACRCVGQALYDGGAAFAHSRRDAGRPADAQPRMRGARRLRASRRRSVRLLDPGLALRRGCAVANFPVGDRGVRLHARARISAADPARRPLRRKRRGRRIF